MALKVLCTYTVQYGVLEITLAYTFELRLHVVSIDKLAQISKKSAVQRQKIADFTSYF